MLALWLIIVSSMKKALKVDGNFIRVDSQIEKYTSDISLFNAGKEFYRGTVEDCHYCKYDLQSDSFIDLYLRINDSLFFYESAFIEKYQEKNPVPSVSLDTDCDSQESINKPIDKNTIQTILKKMSLDIERRISNAKGN